MEGRHSGGSGAETELRSRLQPGPGPAEAQREDNPGPALTAATSTREFKSPLDKKYHQKRRALLGRGNALSLTGFMTLLCCLTTLAAVGLLLENLNKYGLRVAATQWMRVFDARQNVPGFYPALYLLLYIPVQIFVALRIEKAIATGTLGDSAGLRCHLGNLLWHLAFPVLGIWIAGDAISIVGGVILCHVNSIVLLKMWSFVHACWWAREQRKHRQNADARINATEGGELLNGRAGRVDVVANGHGNGVLHNERTETEARAPPQTVTAYPANLTVANLAYFTFAPTLCYEMDYPRNARINWRRVAVRGAMLAVVSLIQFSMLQQWLLPSYSALLGPVARGEWSVVAERVIKIAIPNNVVWLVFFYQLFHLNMILVSELTRFADRRSYESWWDSEDMNVFWRRWNLPVHYWCIRHLYLPLLRLGYSKTSAKWATFILSGVFHEYLVSPPLRIFRLYAFLGMLAQVPIGDLSEWICRRCGPRWGNAVVWLSICLGQPLSVLLYSWDYVEAHDGPEGLAALARIGASAV